MRFAAQGLRHLDSGTQAALLDEGLSLGINPDRAERLIGRVCRALGVSGAPGNTSTNGAAGITFVPRFLRCRSCSGLTDHGLVGRAAGPAPCRHCGHSLRWTCPVCVGRPLGRRAALHVRVSPRTSRAVSPAFRGGPAALSHSGMVPLAHLRAQELAPKHVGTRKGIAKVRERLAEIDRTREAVELAIGARQLVAARRALQAWARLVEPGLADWQAAATAINKGLRDALALVAKARSRERTDPRAARGYYRQSLAIAADLSEALEGLRRCPPDPPRN
ncbi:MAG: hypothetical protein U0794_07180 [Isosphaeraceae bacterium]